jgi:hypothetical protein
MSTHNNHPILPRTPIESPEEHYDPESRRDWVRAAITLSLIFAPTAQGVEALTRRETKLIGSLELLAQSWRAQILAQVGQPLLQSMQGALDMLRVAEGHITPHRVWA